MASDSDVTAFRLAAGITSASQRLAVNYLVRALKANNLWSKFLALYPFVGGTATSHAINLVNPLTFKITWVASPTHSSVGVTFNGTSQYGRTGLVPSTDTTLDNLALHVYMRLDIDSNGIVIGSNGSGAASQANITPRSSGVYKSIMYDTQVSASVFDSSGLFTSTKIAANNHMIIKNGVLLGTVTTSGGTRPTVEVYIGARNNNGTASLFKNTLVAFSAITSGMTSAESALLNTIVERFQSILSRTTLKGVSMTYEGDSFFATPGAYAIPTSIDTYLSSNSYGNTSSYFAVSGSTISFVNGTNYMLATARYNAVTANYQSTAYRNILACWEGTNDINFWLNGGYSVADTVTNCYNGYVSYYSSLAAAGFRVVLNTPTPRADASVNASFELARQNASNKNDPGTVNGLLRNDFNIPTSTAGVFKSGLSKWSNCVLCDVGNDASIGQAGQASDVSKFVDGIHPSASSITIIVNSYYGPAIRLVNENVFFS